MTDRGEDRRTRDDKFSSGHHEARKCDNGVADCGWVGIRNEYSQPLESPIILLMWSSMTTVCDGNTFGPSRRKDTETGIVCTPGMQRHGNLCGGN